MHSLLPLLFPLCGLPVPAPSQDPQAELLRSFAEHRIQLDLERGLCSLPAAIRVRDDLLEYLLTAERGATHETLFSTQVTPSVLNTALLLLGVESGQNASWTPIDPAPSSEELARGAPAHEVELPKGDGFFMYAAWRVGEETFLYRVEDLLRNLRTGRSMQRHRWVYLGSRMLPSDDGQGEVFAADVAGNLVNLSFFPEGITLLTGALEDCVHQTIWLPNAWLIPQRGSEVALILSRERIGLLPEKIAKSLPQLEADGQSTESGR